MSVIYRGNRLYWPENGNKDCYQTKQRKGEMLQPPEYGV